MFRRRNRLLARFEGCEHKTVQEIHARGFHVAAKLDCPVTEDRKLNILAQAVTLDPSDGLRKKGVDTYREMGETPITAYRDPQTAQEHLGRNACAIACEGCVFATMTPIEVSVYRRDRAIEAATVAEYEEGRLEALVALQECQRNITELKIKLDEQQ